jgi:signal transduction histidine kinase
MSNRFRLANRLSFKLQLIITFSTITILVVSIMAWVSYKLVKDIYLGQLSEQVVLMSQIAAQSLDSRYLQLLHPGDQQSLAKEYYQQTLKEQIPNMNLESAFIFNPDYQILLNTDLNYVSTLPDARLQLNRQEIQNLTVGSATASVPFKSEEGLWYMWGFYRLGNNYWLGVKENASRLRQVEDLALTFWLIGFFGVLTAIIASWVLARTIAKPIDELVLFSKTLGRGDFEASVPKNIRGELMVLATAMDQMRGELANKQKEKEEMLAQIAHEIRNPLGGIELLAGLVKENLREKGKNEQYIQKILDEISGLKSLITAYLNYSRPMRAKPEWIKTKTVIEEVQNLLKNSLLEKNIRFSHIGTEDNLWFDPNHIRQILLNLIDNSIQAVDKNGAIHLQTSKNKNVYEIHISDDGPGIPEDNLKSIFEPFFTTRENGTGLGLAICRKLCEENRAGIEVKNNESGGCSYTISKKISESV